jgi:hypothetical protein
MDRLLPELIARITRQPRYKPDVVWSDSSYTHNVFRFFELLFWRKFGIRPELSSRHYFDGSRWITEYKCHSFESVFALTETYIRQLFSAKVAIPIRVWIPLLQTPFGPIPASPYLLAIAFDATALKTATSGVSSITWSHTVTGSNNILFGTHSESAETSDKYVSFTYNGTGMTQVGTRGFCTGGGFGGMSLLINPSTGANNLVYTKSDTTTNMEGASASYSGAAQSGQPDSSNTDNSDSTTTNYSLSTTVVASNCWLILYTINNASAPTAGTGTTNRQTTSSGACALGDSNATVGTGSQALAETRNAKWYGVIASFAPFVATTSTSSTLMMMGV